MKTLAQAVALTLALALAHAADDLRTVVPTASYAQECGACHLPYPPGALDAASWHRLMSRLSSHFGTDASLEADAAREIDAWLGAHAARRSTPAPEDRITRSAWFVREHRGIAASVWQRPAVRSASHCAACHRGAEQGAFDEDLVRLPP